MERKMLDNFPLNKKISFKGPASNELFTNVSNVSKIVLN
jgi:hypothetical protein